MAIDFTDFFTKAGKILFYIETINTARGTTIPPKAKAILDAFNSDELPLKRAIERIESSHRSIQDGATSGISSAAQSLKAVLIETMDADTALDAKDETTALNLLISQMVAESESVEQSVAAATAAANSGNSGDGTCVVSIKRTDGKNQQNAYAETIAVNVSSAANPATATFACRGDVSQKDKLAHDWPMGSGANRTITAVDAAGTNLLTNGDFDDEEDITNAPDDWIVSVGTIGTTVKMTDYEVQRIVVTGPPTAGYYRVNLTNALGKIQTTAPLAYNASGSDLQAAINLLTGFENVTVSTTGTSPLFTHDITFTGMGGNLAELTVTNGTTGGTFTPSTISAGSASVYLGKAVEFDSDGSQLTTINNRVTLEPLSQYAVNLWAMADVVPAAGVITVDLVDGIGGSVLGDQLGVGNSFTFTGAGLTTSFVAKNGTFRTPRILPAIVYLRIRISTAVSVGTSVFLDHAALAKMTEIYPGGPYISIFSGKTPFRAGDGANVLPDGFTVTVTNDRAGEFQEWFNRVFNMAEKGLLLPSASDGSETQANSLIA